MIENRREKFILLDVPIDNVTMEEALDMVMEQTAAHEGATHELLFVNAHCINVSCRDEAYRKILQGAEAVFADGSGIRIAGDIMGTPIVDNVNGTDMFPLLCRRFLEERKTIYLLGASPGTAEKVREWVDQEIGPGVIAAVRDGFFADSEVEDVVNDINETHADLLLVAMGVPRQEHWIHQYRDRLTVPASMGVGGLFDFYSGNISRAPLWMRKIGFEWVWRLMKEPRRMWRRYIIGNVVFMRRVRRAKRNADRQG